MYCKKGKINKKDLGPHWALVGEKPPFVPVLYNMQQAFSARNDTVGGLEKKGGKVWGQ